MNKSGLKKFATNIRIELLSLVKTKVDYFLKLDISNLPIEFKSYESSIKEIKNRCTSDEKVDKSRYEDFIEEVSYTWFNRLVALRFMDVNDITANSLQITTSEVSVDSVLGPKALQIVPRLLDAAGNKVDFENAALETTLEVSSQGIKLLTSKNLMQNNQFKGFFMRFSSLPQEKVIDNKIDIKVTVKTSKKTIQMTKMGVDVNPNALLMPQSSENPENLEGTPEENATGTDSPKIIGDPKNTVVNFLSNLNSQNLKAAYSQSENPNWGSYETFANPTSGFGTVKSVDVTNVSTKANANNTASVNATYTVTDKAGNATSLDVSYGLKATETGWKITSYKINSSQKK